MEDADEEGKGHREPNSAANAGGYAKVMLHTLDVPETPTLSFRAKQPTLSTHLHLLCQLRCRHRLLSTYAERGSQGRQGLVSSVPWG